MIDETPLLQKDQVEPWLVELWLRRRGQWPDEGVRLHQIHSLANEVFENGQAYDPDLIALADGGFPLSVAVRTEADARYRGRGVTVAILDDSFVPVSDIADPRPERLRAFVDFSERGKPAMLEPPYGDARPATPHGTSCAGVLGGTGILSSGFYRGVADGADLVLIQMMRRRSSDGKTVVGESGSESWLRALDWVEGNRERLGIRILCANSVCSDEMQDQARAEGRYPVTRRIEDLVAAGVTVVLPAGNHPGLGLLPVRWAESAITVGGIDDLGRAGNLPPELFHHSYGFSPGGGPKPELLAPAQYVPVPDVPGFPGFEENAVLASLRRMGNGEFMEAFRRAEQARQVRLAMVTANVPDKLLRGAIERQLQESGVIRRGYRHGSGTSVAAAAVAGMAACVLEADPSLTPAGIKAVLTATATYHTHLNPLRQGAGVVNGRRAIASVERRRKGLPPAAAWVDPVTRRVTFTLRAVPVPRVLLVGDFNGWNAKADRHGGYRDPMQRTDLPGGEFVWQRTIAPLPKGWYGYKFLVGDDWWLDPDNPATLPSGLIGAGENSLLRVFV